MAARRRERLSVRKPSRPMRWRLAPVAAHSRMMFPVFGGISGSHSATCSTAVSSGGSVLTGDTERGADGAKDWLQRGVDVGHLTQEQGGAVGTVETARPAGVGQVEAEEPDVVSDR